MNRRIDDILNAGAAPVSPGAVVSRRADRGGGLFSSLRWFHILGLLAIVGGGLVLYARSTPEKKKKKVEFKEETREEGAQRQRKSGPPPPSRPTGVTQSPAGSVNRNNNQSNAIYEQARLEKIKEEEYRRYRSKEEDAAPRIEANGPPPRRSSEQSPVQSAPGGYMRSGTINGMSLEQLRAMKK